MYTLRHLSLCQCARKRFIYILVVNLRLIYFSQGNIITDFSVESTNPPNSNYYNYCLLCFDRKKKV